MRNFYPRPEQGFSLVEVMVTLVVLSIGILGHVSFQKIVHRDTGLSGTRNVASNMAAEKLEDLRAFSVLKTTAGSFAYEDIATNAGGSLANGTVTVGNADLTRSWTVTDYYYDSDLSAPTTSVPTGSPLPDFKAVTVTISWQDVDGQAQSVIVTTHIARVDPAVAARVYR